MSDEIVVDGVTYVKKPIIPGCSHCGDKGWYRIWSGRGEREDVYCDCEAGRNLMAVEKRTLATTEDNHE